MGKCIVFLQSTQQKLTNKKPTIHTTDQTNLTEKFNIISYEDFVLRFGIENKDIGIYQIHFNIRISRI